MPRLIAAVLLSSAFAAQALTITAARSGRAGLTELSFIRCGPGWTGGDSTYSVRLATGETAWLFSDSFHGRVAANADGTRTRAGGESGFVGGNAVVRQRTDGLVSSLFRSPANAVRELQTYALYLSNWQPNPSCPAAGMPAEAGLKAYLRPTNCTTNCLPWMGAPFLGTDGRLRTFIHHHLEQAANDSGDPPLQLAAWTYVRSSLGRFGLAADGKTPTWNSAPGWTQVSIPAAWGANLQAQIRQRIRWGGAVLRATVGGTDYFYVYGTRAPLWDGLEVFAARVPAAQVDTQSAWRYWGRNAAGTLGFHASQTDAVPLSNSVAGKLGPRTGHSLGVMRLPSCGSVSPGGCYVMVGHDRADLDKVLESHTIVAWYALSPQGPWTGPHAVYTTPESRNTGGGDRYTTYDSMVHPWSLSADGRTVLLSYNLNWMGDNLPSPWDDLVNPNSPFVNADSYRPRFIDLTFDW